MKLLSHIWQTATPWKAKRAFLAKLASEATASGDLALALEAWQQVKHGDAWRAIHGDNWQTVLEKA